MYYIKHRSNKKSVRNRIIAAGIASFLIIIFITGRMNSLAAQAVENRARQLFTQAVNEAVSEVLAENKLTYSDLVDITYNHEGEIISAQGNSIAVSRLSAALSTAVQERLEHAGMHNSGIRLGSLTGVGYLAGTGPVIPLRITPDGSVSGNIETKLEEAGVNQSHYQVECGISGRVFAGIWGMNSVVELQTNIILIDTVIVGRVPGVNFESA